MKRTILSALLVGFAWLGLAAVSAQAQNIYPYQPPRYGPGWQTPLSPYLNLLIPGNTAVNYYGLVEPLFRSRQYRNMNDLTLQGIMSQIPEPPGIREEDLDAPLASTGHPTAFNYTGAYFNSNTMGQPYAGNFPQRRGGGMGQGAGPIGGGRRMGPVGMGSTGVSGAGGVWPNMRTGIGQYGR